MEHAEEEPTMGTHDEVPEADCDCSRVRAAEMMWAYGTFAAAGRARPADEIEARDEEAARERRARAAVATATCSADPVFDDLGMVAEASPARCWPQSRKEEQADDEMEAAGARAERSARCAS